jgi:hypothetical protein
MAEFPEKNYSVAMFGPRGSLRSHPTPTLPCKQGREWFFAIAQMFASLQRNL